VRVIDSRADRPPQCADPGRHAKEARLAAAAWRDPELAWLLLWLICLIAIVVAPRWQVIPIAALAVIFAAMAWWENRKVTARDRAVIAAEAERLLVAQRQFLQDASHQLRTPITIALGHAELLADVLAGQQQRDIDVVVGELDRLKTLSEQLLLVATSENPDFLSRRPADLDMIAAELLHRWRPTASRRWRLGQLDPTRALVDVQRLSMALDALVENAVRHTGQGDEITVCVTRQDSAGFARIVVRDSGEGIAEADLPHIFDRFRTIAGASPRGTGLGLALVQAVARGHGGEVSARSSLGQGSTFEVLLPALAAPGGIRAMVDRADGHEAPSPAVPGRAGGA